MTYGHREAIILITVEECTPILQKFLKESRYRHSFAVSEQAVSLALLYGADVEKARIAGLLHDLAKNLSEKQCLQWGKELHVSFDEITRRSPSLWHAVLSEAYVREKLGICDPEVLGCVCWRKSYIWQIILLLTERFQTLKYCAKQYAKI